MKQWMFVVVVLMMGCARTEEPVIGETQPPPSSSTETRPPSSTETQLEPQPQPTETVATPKPREQEIYIDAVTAANPLVVKGRARTFENNVVVRARDSAGKLIVEDFTTSDGEMGHHNPFEAQLWLTRDPGSRVTAEAFEYSAKDGSVRSLTAKTIDYRVEPIAATLVFPQGDCTKFATFKRNVPKTPGMARLLVEALVAGPTAAEKAGGASSPFPKGSDVRSVILRDGTITVDFNERLQNVGGACAATAIRESVTRTLKALPTVKRVVITAGGSEPLALQP